MKSLIEGKRNNCHLYMFGAVIMLGSSQVFAAGFSQPQSQPFTLDFVQPTSPITMSITPVASNSPTLLAGTQTGATVLANVNVNSPSSAYYAFRFTPGLYTPTSGLSWAGTVKEKSSNNSIKLMFLTNPDSSTDVKIGTDTYAVVSKLSTSAVYKIAYDGSQTVYPGTYPISMDAAVYTP